MSKHPFLASIEHFRFILDALPTLISYVDSDHRYQFNNRAYEYWFGCDRNELQGKHVKEVLGEAVYKNLQPALETVLSGQLVTFEKEMKYKDGGTRYVEATYVPHFDDDDEVLGFAALVYDISLRKRMEERLRHQTDMLQAQNLDLDAFAHTVAHDLKDSIHTFIGGSSALRKEYHELEEQIDSLPHSRMAKHLDILVRTGFKLSNIIDELLILAQVKKKKVHREPIEMSKVVDEALQRLEHLIEYRQAEITQPDSWPEAIGYGPWIEEVWVNYISNAIKYGGRPLCIKVGAEAPSDGKTRFWVRDNGHGLRQEELETLFSPFEQMNQVSTEGYGLGLSIVQRIIEKLDGEVGVESEFGQGSVFFFTLPCAHSTE